MSPMVNLLHEWNILVDLVPCFSIDVEGSLCLGLIDLKLKCDEQSFKSSFEIVYACKMFDHFLTNIDVLSLVPRATTALDDLSELPIHCFRSEIDLDVLGLSGLEFDLVINFCFLGFLRASFETLFFFVLVDILLDFLQPVPTSDHWVITLEQVLIILVTLFLIFGSLLFFIVINFILINFFPIILLLLLLGLLLGFL